LLIEWVTLSFRNSKVLRRTLNSTTELWSKTLFGKLIKSIWFYLHLPI